jgi:hypothetical protein
VRLCQIAADRWPLLRTAYPSVNLLRLSGHDFLNFVYAYSIERLPSDKMEEWLLEMDELLDWQDTDSEAAIEAESASFMSMVGKGG